ncbi:small conductance mechanosensitive channel [Peptoniphilus asaccharolyticus DSM 20463]|uniref:Small conductance mechanosensitive channel n=1 Tax=Peptoniphilus asaccharolyticus DSM 20463 TaxID=573058 RepID=A0A1W1VA26_PEPAS|nr:mechanosensitive ion channel domain-containing protein [Peptoniphilus asaccharolyticus]SMB90269.1 small conductance mechanosensitive channel [Peptoniphilus asaccharolyticus DSM 20463]
MSALNEFEKYLRTEGVLTPFGKLVIILVVFLIGFFISKFLRWMFMSRIEHQLRHGTYSNPRLLTIVSILNKVVVVVIMIICVTISLDILGLNTASIMATLGVGSLALSFGAQTLVKDCINGFFIMLENQFSVGDTVIIEGKTGIIEDIGLRTTIIRDFDGSKHIIPNGTIGIVTNQQRGNMRAKVVCSVSASEDPNRVIELLNKKLSGMRAEGLIGSPAVWGVTNNTNMGYEITVVAYAKAGSQYGVEYKLRESIVEVFNENGIKLPIFKYELNDNRR